MSRKNCPWCGSFITDDICRNCESYRLSIENAPSRINGNRHEPHANQFSRKTYPDAKPALNLIMKGLKYD